MKRTLLTLWAAGVATLAIPANAMPAPSGPYQQVALTPVPAMPEGDWDQLFADVTTNRLYVSAEDGAAMEVFDLTSGALVRAGGPVGSPHKVALDKASQHLLVADGQDGTVKVLNTDLTLLKTIPVGAKPDTGVLDPDHRMFYVSSRAGDASATSSRISAISLDTLAVVGTFAVPAQVLKGMTIDKAGNRLFVSMRDTNQIGIVHLSDGTVDLWSPEGVHKSVPLAFDPQSQRLFAGSREPGRLAVIDATSGKVVQSLGSTETSDSMSFDAKNGILYASGDSGMSRYRIAKDGSAQLLETNPALVGKTSLYVGKLHRLYVMRPKKGNTVAALQIYDVAP